MTLGLLTAWLGLAVAAGMIAGSKGRSSFFYFLIGLVLPVVGVVLAIGMSDRRAQRQTAAIDGRPRRDCPRCAERVLARARQCPHCGAALTPIRGAWLKGLLWGPIEPRP